MAWTPPEGSFTKEEPKVKGFTPPEGSFTKEPIESNAPISEPVQQESVSIPEHNDGMTGGKYDLSQLYTPKDKSIQGTPEQAQQEQKQTPRTWSDNFTGKEHDLAKNIDNNILTVSNDFDNIKKSYEDNNKTLSELKTNIEDPLTPEPVKQQLVQQYNKVNGDNNLVIETAKQMQGKAELLQKSKSDMLQINHIKDDLAFKLNDNGFKKTGAGLVVGAESAWNSFLPNTISGIGDLVKSAGEVGAIGTGKIHDAATNLTNKVGGSISDIGKEITVDIDPELLDKHKIADMAGGLAGMVGSMVVGGEAGATAKGLKLLGIGTFAAQGANAMWDEATQKDITGKDRALLTIGGGLVQGAIGVLPISKVMDNAFSNTLVKDVMKDAVDKISKDKITGTAIFDVISQSLKDKAGDIAKHVSENVIKGGVEGFSFGASSKAGDLALKGGYDALVGTDKFKDELQNPISDIVKSGLTMAAGVGILNGVTGGLGLKNAERSYYDKVVKLNNEPSELQKFNDLIDSKVKSGDISIEDHDLIKENIIAIGEVDKQIPETITNKDKRIEAINLITERNNLTNDNVKIDSEMKSLDETMREPQQKLISDNDKRIKEINSDLKDIATGKEKQIKPTENFTPSVKTKIVEPILGKINNAEYINENELNKAADHLYNMIDKIEKSDITEEQKKSTINLIEPLINKIENYEFRTKTEVSTVTEGKTTLVPRTIKTTEKIPALEQSEGSEVTITKPNGDIVTGTINLKSGEYTVDVKGGNQIILGEKSITDRDLKLPSEDKVENPITFDNNGNVETITFETNNGNLITIKGHDKALDLAIQLRADVIGEVPQPLFDQVYTEFQKEIKQEVLVPQPEKPIVKSEPILESPKVEDKPIEAKTENVKPVIKLVEGTTAIPIKEIGTKKVLNDLLRDELGLQPLNIEKGLDKDEGLLRGKEIVDSGENNPLDTIDYVLSLIDKPNTIKISPDDEFGMIYHTIQLSTERTNLTNLKLDLEDKIKSDPTNIDLQADLSTTQQKLLNNYDAEAKRLAASQLMGKVGSNYFRARQISVDSNGEIVNSINRIKTIYGTDISEKINIQLTDLQKRYDELLSKNTKIEKQLADKQAEKVIKESIRKRNVIKKDKKTSEEYAKDRMDILSNMKESLRLAKAQTYLTIPGLPQLAAISPHVLELVKSYADQGIVNLDEVLTKAHEFVKDSVEGISKDDIRDILLGKYNKKAETRSDLSKKLAELISQARLKEKIELTEKGVVTETRKMGEKSQEVKDLSKKLAELKKQVKNEFANVSSFEIRKESKSLSKRIEKGEFFKLPIEKKTFESDPEWVKNNKEKANLIFQVRKLEKEAFDSKKNKYMKGLDWVNRWGRRVIFFGSNAVYTKLSSAAVLGSFVHRLPEQGLGKLNIKAFPEIAKLATMEGSVNLKSEAKFYQEFLNPKKFVQNTLEIAKSGETPLSKELGAFYYKNHIPLVDLFAADTHIMIKDPVKRATFESALINHLKWYADNGIDGTHPLLLESARQAAYKRAEYEIFQNNQKDAGAVKKYFNELEKSGIIQANMEGVMNRTAGNLKYTTAALYHFFVPINSVPLNILRRVGLGIKSPFTLREAYYNNKDIKNGIINMSAEDANLIMLQLKKGQIGAAYWTLGFVLGGSIAGGLYTNYNPNKRRKSGELKSDVLKPLNNAVGEKTSRDIQHNTQLTSLQMGATWRNTYDHYIDDKGASQMEAIAASVASLAGATVEKLPVIQTGMRIVGAAENEYGGKKFIKDLKSRVGINKAKIILDAMGYSDNSK